jgi:hypothetical protein
MAKIIVNLVFNGAVHTNFNLFSTHEYALSFALKLYEF